MVLLTLFRVSCHFALFVFSLVTMGLTAARLHYTLHLPAHDPLNGGHNFYDPIIAEVLATACITIILTPFMIMKILKQHEGYTSRFGSELVVLLILLTLWLVGAAITTKNWGNLNWCHIYSACRVLTAIVAFTWMSTIMIIFLFVACVWYIVRHSGFSHPMHGERYMTEIGGA